MAGLRPGDPELPASLRHAALVREFVSGAIALVVAALFLFAMALDLSHGPAAGGVSGGFGAAIVASFGVVMGYTFSRISTEARAERAERSAASAEHDAREALREASEHRGALETLVRASSPIVDSASEFESAAGGAGAMRIAADYARLELAVNLTREHLNRTRLR